MKYTISTIFSLFILLFACDQSSKNNNAEIKIDFVLKEKDLIPEGVAHDTKNNITYISSTHKRKIVQIDAQGNVSDFIGEQENDIWSVIGMEVDENAGILWVNTAHANQVMPLKNALEEKDWLTSVRSYDIKSKKLIKEYILNEDSASFNDLTVLPNGDVFITDCVQNILYKIDKVDNNLEEYLSLKEFHFLNGITYSENLNVLFITSFEGIIRLDLKNKQHQLLEVPDEIEVRGIDGLALKSNYLIGHLSSYIAKFYFNEEGTKITSTDILDKGKEFDSSTTGELGNGYYHYIVNSQIRSGVDYQNRRILPMDSLEDIIIRKLKL